MGATEEPVATLYETDFAAWAEQQAAALKRGDWRALDIPNLAEEVESMGKQQRAELRHRLAVLLTHLLKLDAQPLMVSQHRSWQLSIIEQRGQVEEHIGANPSLRPCIPQVIEAAFKTARLVAARETGQSLRSFPTVCPYTFDAAMSRPVEEE